MFELIPSDFMRDLFEKKGCMFSDFQKATLIWNMFDKNWDQKTPVLTGEEDMIVRTSIDRETEKCIIY